MTLPDNTVFSFFKNGDYAVPTTLRKFFFFFYKFIKVSGGPSNNENGQFDALF